MIIFRLLLIISTISFLVFLSELCHSMKQFTNYRFSSVVSLIYPELSIHIMTKRIGISFETMGNSSTFLDFFVYMGWGWCVYLYEIYTASSKSKSLLHLFLLHQNYCSIFCSPYLQSFSKFFFIFVCLFKHKPTHRYQLSICQYSSLIFINVSKWCWQT